VWGVPSTLWLAHAGPLAILQVNVGVSCHPTPLTDPNFMMLALYLTGLVRVIKVVTWGWWMWTWGCHREPRTLCVLLHCLLDLLPLKMWL
jgi:hypothetical protein